MARFLVTGGAGFIGSHLVDRLLAEGHDVASVDNFVTGSEENVAHLKKEPRFSMEVADVSASIPDVGKVDGIFHMASPASPADFVPLAIEILKVSSYGTFNALEYAKRHGAWFLMGSTSEVYGDPEVHPQKETYFGNVNPNGVRSVYDEAKRFSEAATMAFRRMHGVQTSIVRIFNTYGPRMRPNDGRVIPNFISQALRGEPLTVYGDGTQTRSLCYVSDLVEGLLRFRDQKPAEPINLGTDQEMTMNELADAILVLTGSKSRKIYKPLPDGDPKQRRPDLSRVKAILKWEPKTPLDAGLKQTIEYFRPRCVGSTP